MCYKYKVQEPNIANVEVYKLISGGQQFHRYQQNEQKKRSTTYHSENPGPDLEQAQK